MNKTILVTGATGKIGHLIAETLSELGSELILVDKPGSDFQNLEKKTKNMCQVKTTSYECNLEDENQRQNLLNQINDFPSLRLSVGSTLNRMWYPVRGIDTAQIQD